MEYLNETIKNRPEVWKRDREINILVFAINFFLSIFYFNIII